MAAAVPIMAVAPADLLIGEEEGFDTSDATDNYVHIRIQQRNGRKTLTTLQGMPREFDHKKILKAFKKVRVRLFGEQT